MNTNNTDQNDEHCHSIFFDDGINDNQKSIVDAWSVFSGKRLSPEEVFKKFTYKVT